MKLVLFNDDRQVLGIQEGLDKVTTDVNEVTWQGGAIKGIKTNFIVLPDEIEVGETINQDVIDQDVKGNFRKKNLVEENEELKGRVKSLEESILILMDWV